jgi:hypothetical protein
MSPDFPRRPRVIKGALIAVEANPQDPPIGPKTPIFVFQYNPNMLTRTFSYPNHEEASTDFQKAQCTQGLPVELINLTLELDATDQLEYPEEHPETVKSGLHPSLAVLESMMYPKLRGGRQPKLPVILFVWGPNRIVPVFLTSMKVTEESFDQSLNPIRAKIDLCLRVLERSELTKNSLGYDIHENRLNHKEALALLYRRQPLVRTYSERASRDIRQHLNRKQLSTKKKKNER